MKTPNFRFHITGIQRTYIQILLILIVTILPTNLVAQQLAFPTAKGAGAYTTGGRGGQVIHVTNLNASGSGSFLEALNTQGTRTIVFDVGGVIDMRSVTGFYQTIMEGHDLDNVTIAGQTAPGGITIEGYSFFFDQVDNIVMRYITVKHVSIAGRQEDGAFIRGNDIIFDNCTFLNGKDETISIYDTSNQIGQITMQHSLIGNGKTGMILGGRDGNSTNSTFSIIENLWVDVSHRFPNTSVYGGGKYDIINNVVYNAKLRYISMGASNGYSDSEIELNYINNYNKTSNHYLSTYGGSYLAENAHQIQEWSLNDTNVSIYTGYNIFKGFQDTATDNDWNTWTNFNYSSYQWIELQQTDWFVNNPLPLAGQAFTPKSETQALAEVIPNSGANAYLNDSHNVVGFDDAQTAYLRSTALNDSATYLGGWDESQAIYGSNTVPGGSRPAGFDTDNDGMPDSWETTTFGDLTKDGTADTDGDGYTDLEEYLNLIEGDIVTVDVTGVTVSPDTATINIPDTITLTKTVEPADASNQSGTWSSNNTAIATVNSSGVVTPVSEGEVIITFNTNDGGFSGSATITVTNIPISVESVSLSPETLDLNINATDVIVATISPANATNQTGNWTSSDTAVATVNQQGLVQPIAIGQTTITFTTNDGGFTDSSIVTINDNNFGNYEFYNADTDALIEIIDGGEVFDLDDIGENVNFRIIPLGGDANPEVESVGIQWNGIENGNYGENAPIYAGMNGHIGNDYQAYTVIEGAYNFTVTYYAEDSQAGNVIAVDNFTLNFTRGSQTHQVNVSEDSSICLGDTAALVASGADSYLWSTGEASETIAVTPNTTTTYTVTGTHSDGSTTEASVTVTVNDIPVVDAGLDQTICAGESVTLTATSTTGTIVWSNGATTTSITVSPSETTIYTVTADNNGCLSSDEVTVNVSALPIADAGTDVTLVNGESATLTASGGGEYLWSTGETTSSIVVSPNTDTTYTVTVTNGSGCTSEDSVNVIVVEAIVANAGDDVTICEGESTILTATGGDNYEWSTGETTQSITVSPSETTTYTVTVSNQSTSDTDSVIVTVLDQPIADVSNDITISSGQSATLLATGGDSYEWSTGETTESIIVTPLESTTYTVTVFNANGCNDTASVTVSVIEPIVANAGDDVAICEGESTTLTATGGDSYEWSTGETTQSITVSPENTTNYSVTVSDNFSSDTDSVLVTVNPVPVVDAGNDVTINQGESVTLYASGGNTYLWSTGETNANISVSPTETTTYTVTTSINGCSDTDEVTVTVITLVQAFAGDDQSICLGEEIILTASGGDDYEWSNGETTQSITVNPDSDTIYTVTVTNQYGSDSDDVSVQISDCPALDFEFIAFPNPTDGIINVKLSGLQEIGVIQVTDILGKQLKYIEIMPNSGQLITKQINISGMNRGFYLLNFYGDNRVITKKMILR